MNEQTGRAAPHAPTALEDVLDAYIAASEPDVLPLAEWVRRFPQYERELTEFAASWSLMKSLPPPPDAEEIDEQTLVLRGMSIVQNLLHGQRTQAAAATTVVPFESLVAEGRARGVAPRQLAQAAGIGEIVLRKLDRRLIAFGRLPREASEALVAALAAALERGTESIARYLQQGPVFAAAAHRAEQAPQLAEPEDFFDAVRNDPTMTDEQRARWLAFEPGAKAD